MGKNDQLNRKGVISTVLMRYVAESNFSFVILDMNPSMQSHIDSLFQGDNPDMRCIITISNPYGDEAIQVPGKEFQYDACKKIVVHVDNSEGGPLFIDIITKKQSFTHSMMVSDKAEFFRVLDDLSRLPFKQWHAQTPRQDLYIKITPMTSRGQTVLHRFTKPSKSHWQSNNDDFLPIHPGNAAQLLHAIGIVNEDFAIIPAMRDKYVQINHFIRIFEQYAHEFKEPVNIVDCGCGQAYVSIALLWYLRNVKHVNSRLIGIEQNGELIASCNRTIQRLDMNEHASFSQSTIADWTGELVENGSLIVIALHACDTATDDALSLAISHHADIILAAPCCHHHVQQQMNTASIPQEESFLLRDGIMKERLGDMLTDTMRRDILMSEGYSADLIEFTPLEHTAKNIMIRAKRVVNMPHKHKDDARNRWMQARDRWHVEPKLAELLRATM